MEQYRRCNNCNVDISSDLSNCPLCGKYVLNESKKEQPQQNKYSFPIYSMNEIYRAKWVNIIRLFFWLIGGVCLIINLIWKTTPYFFPYVITALVMIMVAFISPFSKKESYFKNITRVSIIISLFLIFIDAYDYYTLRTSFGWALSYSSPLFLTAMVLASAIVCLASKRHEIDMIKSVAKLLIYSVIYFLVVLCAFPDLTLWPSFVFMMVSIGWFFILQIIKRNLLWKELAKNFHI